MEPKESLENVTVLWEISPCFEEKETRRAVVQTDQNQFNHLRSSWFFFLFFFFGIEKLDLNSNINYDTIIKPDHKEKKIFYGSEN